ncbi:carbonic anhydrase [Galendromus occidentalis]|uniref:carbonic anhydrase n=1 Tax=Galendromus occidentalis TaxID=34638 RepID=A0AAJ6QVX0_9ACAR|nr:carbonic anhydrase [Galendromus occidentalis]
MPQTWGYSECNGPKHWGKDFPLALGHRQSPVNIVSSQAVRDPMLLSKPLKYQYEDVAATQLTNGGFGWRVDVNSPSHNLEGGPLNHRYKLVQFHAHWGPSCCSGSEHTIDGTCTAGELHLVHYNIDLYDEPAKAMSGENGLAVVGILLKEGDEHPEFEKICSLIDKIKHKGSSVTDVGPFNLRAFYPHQPGNYFTYEGSLTTPPCYESVTWILMRECIELSKAQLDKFRSMLNYCEGECELGPLDGTVQENYRDCQPLEGRVIRCSGCDTPPN